MKNLNLPLLNFPDSGSPSVYIKSFTAHKKLIGFYLIAELEEKKQFYNSKLRTYQYKTEVRIEGRGIFAFFKFFTKKYAEVHIISIEDNVHLAIADLYFY